MRRPPEDVPPEGGNELAAIVKRVQDEGKELRRQVAEGFHGAHCRANGHAAKTLETESFLLALIELLSEQGMIDIDQLDDRKRAAFKRQKQRYARDRMGVVLQDSEVDKYAFKRTAEIDCQSRVHLCKASCCRLPFALSRQDVEERVVRWNFGVPYMIEQGADGYCTHHDRCTRSCTIYQQRPVPCRGYDCRKDRRIWLDFDRRIANPAIERPEWLDMVSEEDAD